MQVILIFNNNVWGDEAFTILTVKEEDSQIFWKTLINDVHPPLYYMILRFVINIIGDNLQIIKIVSLLPIFLTNSIIIYFTLKDKIRATDINNIALLAIYLIITNITPNFLYMGLEVRMYSWGMFFVTMSGIYAYKIYNDSNKKNIIVFILMSLGAALTHYFALIMESIIYIYLFVFLTIKSRKNIKQIIIMTILTIFGYLWWLPKAIQQFTKVSNDFWLTFTKDDILVYFKSILGIKSNVIVETITIAFLSTVLLFILYRLIIKKDFNKEEKKEIIFGFLLITLTILIIIIGIVLNITIRPIFTIRYLMPSLNLFWIGTLLLIKHINCRKTFITLVGVIVLMMALIGYKNKYKAELKTGTNNTINFMNENLEEEDILTSNISHLSWTILKYYFPENKVKDMNYKKLKQEDNRIWYFTTNMTKKDKEKIKESGYDIEYMYKGNIDNTYNFVIYKLDKIQEN